MGPTVGPEAHMRWRSTTPLIMAAAAACSGTTGPGGTTDPGGSGGGGAAPVASVTLSPATAIVVPQGTIPLTATLEDAAGNVLTGRIVTWTSSDPTVATVTATGVVPAVSGLAIVAGVAAGATTIIATSEGQHGSTAVTAMNLVLTQVSAGARATCGAATNGVAFCWGWNDMYQLGNSLTTAASVPSAVWGARDFIAVSAQWGLTCGLTSGGSVFCWGSGGEPAAPGTYDTNTTASAPKGGGFTFKAVSVGDGQACALTTAGSAYCWGWNHYGQLGTGDQTDHGQPAPIAGGLVFSIVSLASDDHTCGLTTSGAAYCWGFNREGQLGASSSDNCMLPLSSNAVACSLTPLAVSGGLTLTTLSAGSRYTCGLTADGTAYCWGSNSSTPVAVLGGLTFTTVSVGGQACGVTSAGAAYCWSAANSTPALVPGGLTFATVSVGSDHVCGLTPSGVAYCWGGNSQGQLGDGTQTSSSVPVKVLGQP